MKISTSRRAIFIALVGVALVSAAPAMGASARTQAAPGASAVGSDDGKVITRRDGSRAVPFVPIVGPSSSATEPDGFDWADAALGAGIAMSLVGLGATTLVMIRRRMTISPSASTS